MFYSTNIKSKNQQTNFNLGYYINQINQVVKGLTLLGAGTLVYLGLSRLFNKTDTPEPKKQLISQQNNNLDLRIEETNALFSRNIFKSPYFPTRALLTIDNAYNDLKLKDKTNQGVFHLSPTRRTIFNTEGSGGCEFQVNSYTTDSQQGTTVTGLTDGGFVIIWESLGNQDGDSVGVYGQCYNITGNKVGNEFQINTYTTNEQIRVSVSDLNNGGFVVIWTSLGQDGNGYGIYGQRYGAIGIREGNEFQVNTYTLNSQMLGSNSAKTVAKLTDGGFMVVWNSMFQDNDNNGIFGQRYDDTGAKVGNETQINSYTVGIQELPSVAGLIGGGFVIVWDSIFQDGDDYGIYGQRYNAVGNKAGSEFQVNSYTTYRQSIPSVASLTDGGFVVTWHGSGQSGVDFDIYGQRYNSIGTKIGNEFQINSYKTDMQRWPSVAGLTDGGFVVVWQSYGQDSGSNGVYGQRYNVTGEKVGNEFRVNTYTTGTQGSPSVAGLSKGGFVVTWCSALQDGSSNGIYGRTSAPCLVQNNITITEGQTIVINSIMLNSIDIDTPNTVLNYTIRNLQHGQFEKVSNPGIAITSFSQQEIIDKNIQFVHDGSEIAPSYEVKVSDGELETSYQAAVVNYIPINDHTPMLISNHITINEG